MTTEKIDQLHMKMKKISVESFLELVQKRITLESYSFLKSDFQKVQTLSQYKRIKLAS